jgi:hypothetical protein
MSDIKFIYVRTEDVPMREKGGAVKKDANGNVVMTRGFPLGCFAYRTVSICQRGEETGKTLQYGYSVFNPNDKFDRNAARVAAQYRLTFDCRASYATPHWHANDHLSTVLSDTANTEIHQWARDEEGNPQLLPLRFRKACARMANHLREAKENQLEDKPLCYGLGAAEVA